MYEYKKGTEEGVRFRLVFDNALYAQQETQRSTFKLYPNPVQDYLNLEVLEGAVFDFQYTIYGLDGRIAQQGHQTADGLGVNLSVDEFSTGTYMLLLELGTEQVVHRFVKQ